MELVQSKTSVFIGLWFNLNIKKFAGADLGFRVGVSHQGQESRRARTIHGESESESPRGWTYVTW